MNADHFNEELNSLERYIAITNTIYGSVAFAVGISVIGLVDPKELAFIALIFLAVL